jgi:hypothetical protein
MVVVVVVVAVVSQRPHTLTVRVRAQQIETETETPLSLPLSPGLYPTLSTPMLRKGVAAGRIASHSLYRNMEEVSVGRLIHAECTDAFLPSLTLVLQHLLQKTGKSRPATWRRLDTPLSDHN